MVSNLQLGTKVSFDHRQVRDFPADTPLFATWNRVPCERTDGVVVGLRRLNRGRIIPPRPTHNALLGFLEVEDEPTWRTEGTIPSVLVATGLRTKHVRVHPDDITIIEGD